jgi:AAA15 family ATPase/GTPase
LGNIRYIKTVKINKFRLFKDISFNCGKYITAIAGRNATGKSTLLGMIAHSSELKVGEGKPIHHSQFRSEFSELFNASKRYDIHERGLVEYEITMCDSDGEIVDDSSFRITWQDKGDRFRLIPKRVDDGKKTESKFKHASLYLGLSRLYPIAEISPKSSDFKKKEIRLAKEEKVEFTELYNRILDTMNGLESIDIVQTSKSNLTNIGISTDCYDAFVNSAGQNNLGKIILALLSFKRQSENNVDSYTGGVLCIDELDATLHPAAQRNLLSVLKKYAQKYSIQVIFTTHSLYLLNILQRETQYNKLNEINKVELIYLTSANGPLKIIGTPSDRVIYNEITEGGERYNIFKVSVFTEDDEARWFVIKLLKLIPMSSNIRIAEIKIGRDEYKALYKHDPSFFEDSIIILDGDSSIPNKKTPFMKLPGETNPELVFHDFLRFLDSEAWDEISAATEYGFSKSTFMSNSWESYDGKEDREKQKEWFKSNKHYFEVFSLFNLWKSLNEDKVKDILDEFKIKYNKIARRNNITLMP